jgi:hypothetical protein
MNLNAARFRIYIRNLEKACVFDTEKNRNQRKERLAFLIFDSISGLFHINFLIFQYQKDMIIKKRMNFSLFSA